MEMKSYFKPEFINRLDEIVFFHSITPDMIRGILEIQLGNLTEKVRDQGLNIQYSEELREHLIRMGYDPEFGARPLKRLVQREIGTALSEFILRGEYTKGETVLADYIGNKVFVRMI